MLSHKSRPQLLLAALKVLTALICSFLYLLSDSNLASPSKRLLGYVASSGERHANNTIANHWMGLDWFRTSAYSWLLAKLGSIVKQTQLTRLTDRTLGGAWRHCQDSGGQPADQHDAYCCFNGSSRLESQSGARSQLTVKCMEDNRVRLYIYTCCIVEVELTLLVPTKASTKLFHFNAYRHVDEWNALLVVSRSTSSLLLHFTDTSFCLKSPLEYNPCVTHSFLKIYLSNYSNVASLFPYLPNARYAK